MGDKIKIGYDENYEPSDSEDELDEEERELIDKVRKRREVDDPKKEVLRFDESESDEDDDEEDGDGVADSDIEDGDDYDGIPDERAWGKKRSAYYHTDFVDQDYSTYTEKEREQAEQEEEEAKAIQQRLAKQLDEADFTLDIYSETATDPQIVLDTSKTKLKTDFTKLSARQKEQLFKKDSPEFAGLVQDFEKYVVESRNLLNPIIKYAQANNLEMPVFDFARTRNNLILSYCTNIGFYLVLKSKRIPVKNHPIVKQLVQLRELIVQLDDTFTNVVKPQLEELLEAISTGDEVKVEPVTEKNAMNGKTKKLTILKAESKKKNKKSRVVATASNEDDGDDFDPTELMDTSDEEMQNAEEEDADVELNDDDEAERRGITYQIAKNKGLTPSRKKENRNPRVKHRNKFKKALVRRKGAVRTVRKELSRYGGEMSGIKANVRKGIKLKS